MDGNQPHTSIDTDSETALLLVNLESAVRSLERAEEPGGTDKSLASLAAALHTYGSIKHLLPKLNLSAVQRAPVEQQLQKLRAKILVHGLNEGR